MNTVKKLHNPGAVLTRLNCWLHVLEVLKPTGCIPVGFPGLDCPEEVRDAVLRCAAYSVVDERSQNGERALDAVLRVGLGWLKGFQRDTVVMFGLKGCMVEGGNSLSDGTVGAKAGYISVEEESGLSERCVLKRGGAGGFLRVEEVEVGVDEGYASFVMDAVFHLVCVTEKEGTVWSGKLCVPCVARDEEGWVAVTMGYFSGLAEHYRERVGRVLQVMSGVVHGRGLSFDEMVGERIRLYEDRFALLVYLQEQLRTRGLRVDKESPLWLATEVFESSTVCFRAVLNESGERGLPEFYLWKRGDELVLKPESGNSLGMTGNISVAFNREGVLGLLERVDRHRAMILMC